MRNKKFTITVRLALLAIMTCVLSSCVTLKTVESSGQATLIDNVELMSIRETDQADRAAGANIDRSIVGARDEARLARVRELVVAGSVRTARDYFNAALVAQHGKTVDDIRLAFSLATISASIDPNVTSSKWLSAAA